MKYIQIKNAKEWPTVYSCKFLEAGVVSYEDIDEGIAYLKKETIDKMAPTFIGRPVIISHLKVNPDNFKDHAVGYVVSVRFEPSDAWFYCDFIITDDKARDLIEKENYSVSCAYTVIAAKGEGLWHDIKYDGEITEGSFTHLALVKSPRYEDSKITKQLPMMLVNEKTAHLITNKEDTEMNIKELINSIFNKKSDGSKEAINPVVILNGKEYPLSTVLEAIQEKFNGEGEMKGVMAKDTDLVDINGHSFSVADIKKNYKPNEKKNCTCNAKDGEEHKDDCAMYNKKNEKTDDEKMKEEKDKENAKKTADAAAENKRIQEIENAKKLKEKENQEFFNSLETLANSNPNEELAQAPAPLTRQERANKKRDQVAKQFTK